MGLCEGRTHSHASLFRRNIWLVEKKAIFYRSIGTIGVLRKLHLEISI